MPTMNPFRTKKQELETTTTSSITSQSLHSSEEEPPQSPAKIYNVSITVWRNHYKLTTLDDQPVYYAENSTFNPKKPSLTIHSGPDDKGPIVAVCKFAHFSRHFKVALGDPDNIMSTQWEDVVSQSIRHNNYRWQMTLGSQGGERRSFLWKRTRSVGVDNEKVSALSSRNFKLVDEASGRLLAVFTSDIWSFRKAGKLQFYVDYGKDFEVMAFVVVLGLYEKERRRQAAAASSGGGGGGGGG